MRVLTWSKSLSAEGIDGLNAIKAMACGLVVMLIWLGWTMVDSGGEARIAARRETRTAELRGDIARLGDKLTMSARMAVASSEPRWAERYRETAAELEAVITDAVTMVAPALRASLASTTVEANRDLRVMEAKALSLVAEGQHGEAQALLNGPEFNYLQDVYASGIDLFARSLTGGAEADAAHANQEAWLKALGFCIGVVFLAVAFMAARSRVRLRAAASRDALTGLTNRRQFRVDLAAHLAQPRTDGGETALVVIGLDRFKAANDAYGHTAADGLLQQVAARLLNRVQANLPIARTGGDEFTFLIEADTHLGGCEAEVDEALAALRQPYVLADGSPLTLGISAGTTRIDAEPMDAGEAIRQAELALRQAKADGRGGLHLFDQALETRLRDRRRLEADLRTAIEGDVVVPFFQPLVDLRSGEVVGVEVLARWHHAERGWVSPADFIPMAEDLGLIGTLMEHLLRQACRAARPWPGHITLAFNVSPLQLQDESLPGTIRAILAETDFPARRLEVEVTESALVHDLDLARRLLEDLRDDGVGLALDDFGTGYSSLKHLRCLPFDKLKIDASFVGGMVDDEESGKIVAAVVGLGHSLGLSTVAEGVETKRVADLLRDLGCDIGQGWLYGRPMSAADLAARITPAARPALVA